jgi:hypothetical protein
MVNLFQRIKFYCAYYSLWVLLIISHTTIASDFPAIAPCYQQSDSKQSCLIQLPEEAVQKLKIDAGFGWGIFSGTIYNGNENFHVTQLIVSMVPIHDHHHMDMHATMSHEPKVYQIGLEVPPQSKGAISMPLANEDAHIHDFDWKIIKVMGYRMH